MHTEKDETRARIVAGLIAGDTPSELAIKFGVRKSTILKWRDDLPRNPTDLLPERKREEFSELIGNLLYESLTTLAVQVQHFRNPDWLFRQTAGELALLHSTVHDKTVRILEAAERANSASSVPQAE